MSYQFKGKCQSYNKIDILGQFSVRWSCGVVVITSALHAEGPRFDPEQDHLFPFFFPPFPQRQRPDKSDPNLFLARVLQYLETPQYLRKALFPKHSDLRFVGLLNPLDCPHHMRIDDKAKYREGVVLDRPAKAKAQGGSYVNAGMRKA